jgi:hypothetical protein
MEDPTDNEEVIFAQIGLLLLLVQDFEHLLERSLKIIFADQVDLTPEKLFSADKRTLGALLKDLRARAHIEENIDVLLTQVLEDRNLFVHNLRQQPWFDTKTTKGRDQVFKFFFHFQPRLGKAIELFTAVIYQDMVKRGFNSPEFQEMRRSAYWSEILNRSIPDAQRIKKKS